MQVRFVSKQVLCIYIIILRTVRVSSTLPIVYNTPDVLKTLPLYSKSNL